MKKRSQHYELNISSVAEKKKAHDQSLMQTNFFKPTQAVIPCLGSGANARTGSKVT